MNYIGQKTLDELVQGDIISIEPTIDDSVMNDIDKLKEHIVIFTTICPNQNISPTGDIHCFGGKHWRHIPRQGKVYYFGETDDPRFESEERLRKKSKELFETIKGRFDKWSLNTLENAFYVKLFGKRGTYEESGNRLYLPYCYNVVKRLAAKLQENTSKVMRVDNHRYDDIDTSYSRAYETECYGSRHTDVTITFEDGEKCNIYL